MRPPTFGRLLTILTLAGLASLLGSGTPALADIDPNSGIDLVRIGATNNAPWAGDGTVGDRAVGRGAVGYEYSIGKFEVTTSQWVEFFNAAYDRPANDRLPHLIPPTFWGAAGATPNTPGGLRWSVPTGREMIPVGNISWRMAAMYCNWLHNDKATNREAFLDGAYDASTFTYTPGGRFRDQQTHSPGARYWVPTWDEWLKAAHYDPNKINPDGSVGGYWKYSNGSDIAFVSGPPGVLVNGVPATSNFGWDGSDFPGFSPGGVPLGAYATVTSPFGLYDVSGGTGEWTEECFTFTGDTLPSGRFFEGSYWYDGFSGSDHVAGWSAEFPSYSAFDVGFRIASSVPSPGVCGFLASLLLWRGTHRRRPHEVLRYRRLGTDTLCPDRLGRHQVHDRG